MYDVEQVVFPWRVSLFFNPNRHDFIEKEKNDTLDHAFR